MAALVVQSRFAGLKIEDDEQVSNDSQKSKKNKTPPPKKAEPPKKPTRIPNNKVPQSLSKKRKHKPVEATTEQWEMWKQKDEEIVDGNFETQLQEAILLSKLDYEEKKDVYKQLKKEADMVKKLEEQTRPGHKKQKKRNVMSLEQFNDMVTHGDEPNFINVVSEKSPTDHLKPERDTKFFDRVRNETRDELLKEKIIARVRHQTLPDEVITRIQFAEALERKDKEITSLKQEIIDLKGELLTVKSRNKKLCNILGQGEMKDKAEILVEVEKLRSVQSELTTELASLHTDLEKERSKNADPRAKDKTLPDEVITRIQFAEALERKDKEITSLKQEIIDLKGELLTVKSRNKKLCNILGQGEMKDKAEILVEVEKLRSVQSELTTELASLHTDLEKERSKNADPRAKDKTLPDEVITRIQFAEALERKDKEITSLKQEIIDLKGELLTVKSRNKKLCNILGQGEMKDKAEILVEVEKLRSVQSELTTELASLHTDLEKERSKNVDPRAKDKKKRGWNGDRDK